MFFNVLLSLLIIWVTYTTSKIIIYQNEYIMDVPFESIQEAVRSGYMKCGLENENKTLNINENVYNGTHIIFGYERACYNISGIDHSIKENVYKEKFQCYIYLINPVHSERRCSGRTTKFIFEDTCAIAYDKACQFLGPCIGKFEDNSLSSPEIFLQFDNDTVKATSKDIQTDIGKIITCSDTLQREWKENETQFDTEYQIIFRFGEGTCAIERTIFDACSCCFPAVVNVQDVFGQKVNKKPIKKNEMFH